MMMQLQLLLGIMANHPWRRVPLTLRVADAGLLAAAFGTEPVPVRVVVLPWDQVRAWKSVTLSGLLSETLHHCKLERELPL